MKKTALILFVLICTVFLTSCGSNVQIQTQEMPATEKKWAETLIHWYPDWEVPVVVQKIEQ
jgi:hypothetical protein